jgi:hypothetical protein
VVAPQTNNVLDFACTVAGASAGNFARHWADSLLLRGAHSLVATFVHAAIPAVLIGFALAAGIRVSTKTVLLAAGGAAGSISIFATCAATATPARSLLGLAALIAGAVIGVPLGSFVARSASHPQPAQLF